MDRHDRFGMCSEQSRHYCRQNSAQKSIVEFNVRIVIIIMTIRLVCAQMYRQLPSLNWQMANMRQNHYKHMDTLTRPIAHVQTLRQAMCMNPS